MSPQVTKGGIQGVAVGAAACRMRVPPKARSRRREPQSELIEFTKHSLSVARMEKGSATSITQALTQYNKKPPGIATTGGLCFVHCMNPMDKFSSPYLSLVYAPWRKSQVCTQKINTSPAKGSMIHRESGGCGAVCPKTAVSAPQAPNWRVQKQNGSSVFFTQKSYSSSYNKFHKRYK